MTFGSWLPYKARLNKDGIQNAWMPEFDEDFSSESWLVIDLSQSEAEGMKQGSDKILTGLSMQGASRYMYDVFVSSFTLDYSMDGKNWRTVRSPAALNGNLGRSSSRSAYFEGVKDTPDKGDAVFKGNFDDDTENFMFMPHLIIAKYIRFRPKTWRRLPAVRLELYGCDYKAGMKLPERINSMFDGSNLIEY